MLGAAGDVRGGPRLSCSAARATIVPSVTDALASASAPSYIMFATAGDAVEAMRGQLQTLAGARARANMFVDESDLMHHFRMQESKAGHVSRADFAKVLVQVFPTLPLAESPGARHLPFSYDNATSRGRPHFRQTRLRD